MAYMTVPQVNKFLTSLENPGKWGWKTTHDKIATYLLKGHKRRIRSHKDPDGHQWAKLFVPPKPKVGEKAPILLDNGRIVTETIRSYRGKRRNKEYRKKVGIPTRKIHSLHRPKAPSGHNRKMKATKIWEFLSARGRSVRTSRHDLSYGFTPGTEWVKRLHYGGTFKGKSVPSREIVGMNEKDIMKIESIYRHDMMRKIRRGQK